MAEVQLNLNEQGKGAFVLRDEGRQIGEMDIGVLGTSMRVYHTEVDQAYEGQGMAKKLLEAMVDYARANNLKVTPLCAYVHAQFKRHPDEYADIWNRIEL